MSPAGLLTRGAEIDIQRVSAAPAVTDAQIIDAVNAALRGRRETAELCVRIVGADEGRALNARYRGRDAATNVLSFPCDPGVAELPLLGDLVLCVDVVAAEARAQGKAEADHYRHLIVHGVLHLLGYDHVSDDDAQVMEAAETAILAGLGIADPYAPAEYSTG